MTIENWKAPYLPYEEIRIRALDFLNRYNTNDEIPVSIEKIIEFKLGIDIIPINSLRDVYNIDGFISNDFKEICVDYNIWEKYENRYYFTLAHEIGHMVLHADFYNSVHFSNTDEWIKIIENIDPKQYSFLEWHAYCFAGLILVPEHHLKEKYQEAIKLIEESGFDKESNPDMFNEYVSSWLQEKFKVSDGTIKKRIEYDKLS